VAERRRFTRRERNALFALWHGRCAECATPLGDGWHADHFLAWTRGGKTEITNGRPTCPECNLRKGTSVEYQDAFDPTVRPFQGQLVNAVLNRYAAREKVTVALVWCGSGKTLGYQAAATGLMRLESRTLPAIKYVLVYAPRVTLALQAETNYRAFLYDSSQAKVMDPSTGRPVERGDFAFFDETCRLEKLYHRTNAQPLLPQGLERIGLISTYQSLVADSSKPSGDGGQLHLSWARRHAGEFLLVADEAQFCGAQNGDDDLDSPAAGRLIAQMAEFAGHVLLLTATADRADGRKLVLCDDRYEVGARKRLFLRPDVAASYSDGIAYRYLRQFDAAIVDAGITLKSGVEYDLSMASLQAPGERTALAAVLRDRAVWEPLCDLTVKRLRTVKRSKKEYRALIACMRQDDALNVVEYLRVKYPELKVALAISKDGQKALDALKHFKEEPYDVLVSVRMAFIGYDCPEITVVGVLTNYRDLGHLTQLVFRGGRIWKGAGAPDGQRLHLIVPDDEAMQRFIAYLRKEEARGISERDGTGEGPSEGPGPAELESARATDIRGATNGEDIPADDYAAYQADLDEFGPILTPADLRAYWERKQEEHFTAKASASADVPEAQELPGIVPAPGPRSGRTMTDGQARDRLKGSAAKEIGKFLRTRGWKPADPGYGRVRARLTAEVNDSFSIDGTSALSTSDEAEKYLAHVERHLDRLNDEGWR
jgi:superfamily II DNA or RNA helicase